MDELSNIAFILCQFCLRILQFFRGVVAQSVIWEKFDAYDKEEGQNLAIRVLYDL